MSAGLVIALVYRETDFLWNWVFTLESLTYWVFADFKWVLVKFIWITELFFMIFYVTSTILIGYSFIPLLIFTSGSKNNWVFKKINWIFKKNNWVFKKTNWVYFSNNLRSCF